MKNGIYYLTFTNFEKYFGNGIFIIEDNIINGGDLNYCYKGFIVDDIVSLSLEKHTSADSFFGNTAFLQLNLNIHEVDQHYILVGKIENIQTVSLVVNLKFIGNLQEDITQ